jgi:hypothetical protein
VTEQRDDVENDLWQSKKRDLLLFQFHSLDMKWRMTGTTRPAKQNIDMDTEIRKDAKTWHQEVKYNN